jgi:hypothetical protein
MTNEQQQTFVLDDDPEVISNDNDVFPIDDDDDFEHDIDQLKVHDSQWINELRVALERGCDLGSIRNIGKCRPLVDDLRLSVWKVSRTRPNWLVHGCRSSFPDMFEHQRDWQRRRIHR